MGAGLRAARSRVRGGRDQLKLLDITEFYSPVGGGVRTYLAAKAQWIADQPGIEHAIAVPCDRNEVTRLHKSRVYHLRGRAVPASPGYHFLTSARALVEVLERERPDVIEVGSPFLAPWVTAYATKRLGKGEVRNRKTAAEWETGEGKIAGKRVRIVGFYHSDLRGYWVKHGLGSAPGWVRGVGGSVLGRYMRAVYGRFDATIVATPYARDELAWAGVRNTHVVPLGADPDVFHPGLRDDGVRGALTVDPDAPVALYVGRLSREKGLDVVLAALPDLNRELGLTLALGGEGHLRSRLEREARRHPDRLRVLPYVRERHEMARVYASTDVFVAPCAYETFGLAAVEAMASGLPVVGADAGGAGDLLRGAGWGRGFRPGDPSDFARAVRDVVAAGTKALGQEARRAAIEQFSWERTFEALFGVYRRLA
ncbi:MAG: glycosyltransferase [Gemmatimonadales bacterium]